MPPYPLEYAGMFTPDKCGAFALMFVTMFCWGSWANAFSFCRGKYRFELFYWDYAAGVFLGMLALCACLGPQSQVFHGAMAPDRAGWALLSGAVFNIGNVLLVAAISLTGLAVAFPVCIGLALLIGVGVSWWINPAVEAKYMAVGGLLILASMFMDAAAYRAMAKQTVFSLRGLIIAIIGGVFMGAFPPCLQKAIVAAKALDQSPLDPYAASVMMAAGIVVCTLLTNYVLMRRPIAGGPPVAMAEYFRAPAKFHLLGLIGGAAWGVGSVLNFIASGKVGMAVAYAFGTGGVLVAALWGVFLWREFVGAPRRSYLYLLAMFVLFLAGIAVIGYAK
jgi:glucose uptake protein